MERTVSVELREGRGLFSGLEKLLVGWCHTMHDDISWPRRGEYQCRRCGRCYSVPWVEQATYRRDEPALPMSGRLEHARTA